MDADAIEEIVELQHNERKETGVSYILKTTDDLIARSENCLLYRTYHGSYFAVCVCGKMLGLKITREIAEQSWCDHWTAMPFCHDPRI